MENQSPITPVVPPAPPLPLVAPAPTPTTVAPTSGSGGMGGKSIIAALKSINVLEVGFGILGSAALYYTIFYFKYSNSLQKSYANELRNQVDDLKIQVSDIASSMEQKQQNTASQLFF